MTTRAAAVRARRAPEEQDPSAENENADDAAVHTIPTMATPAQDFNAQHFVAAFMQSFAQTQAEMNRNLIESLRVTTFLENRSSAAATPTSCASAPAAPAAATAGNFSTCTARFDGRTRDPETLEAFLDAVETYKECTAVSDEHAVRGLSMLLEGEAAVWWRGVKATVPTWAEAAARLRAMYGAPRPAHELLREIFAAEQNEERAEVFVCRLRALIVRLPYSVPEAMQVDIIYGLLHRRIRKRLPRDIIESVDSLLTKARVTEDAVLQVKRPLIPLNNLPYTNENAARRGSEFVSKPCASSSVSAAEGTISNAFDIKSKMKRSRARCSFCKVYGHAVEECRNLRQKTDNSVGNNNIGTNKVSEPSSSNTKVSEPIRCYGCGKQGVVRSRCENCNMSKRADFNCSDVLYYSDEISSHPMLTIGILGREGVAIADTGATHCIASPALYEILVAEGVIFQSTKRTLRFADGSQQSREVLTAGVPVTIEGRQFETNFMVIPDGKTKTLLGFEFLSKAGIVLDGSRDSWSFADDLERRFDFIHKYHLSGTEDAELMRAEADELSLRSDEGPKLSPDQRRTLNAFISDRTPQFAINGPPTDFATHRIKVSENQEPIASPPYRISPKRKEALKVELDKLLRDEVIEECESPWASNVVLVSKKDGSLRLCIDYRKLNAVTEPDRYPLPRIEDVLHEARTSEYMTTLDLRSGYYQVNVHPDDRDKTAFTTPLGTFRFTRMPMGLRNSGATFQRLIDRFRSNLKEVSLLAYLDDLIILSPGPFERHLADLEAVFDRLAMFGLRINRAKSNFARDSVKFLGHVLLPGGIHTDPDKTAAISAMDPPRNVKHLKCFLQTSSWFRRFIPGYADVARPLTNLLKKSSTFRWGEEQQQAFEKIKTLLTSAPILRQADESQPFVLRTDSSGYCLGAVLMQGEGSDERPIEYASRQLNAAERNYSTTEREALAVVWAVGKFRGYIEGAQVTVKSDHQPLRWLMSLRSPSGRLARWALVLQEFDLRIEYTPGRSNVIADTLSRPPCSKELTSDCDLCYAVVDFPARTPGDVRENQLKDAEVRQIVTDLEADDDPFRGRQWTDRGYVLSDGILYRYGPDSEDDDACLVVPEHERAQVLADYHDAPTAGHFGAERTLQRISRKYYWPGMRAYVADYVKRCVACQRYKVDTRKPAGLVQTPATARRFEVLSVDLFGPLPETADGNKWILIVEDVCTRWVELFALQQATSLECAKVLIAEVFLRYGVARRMVSDNGVQFISEIMQQVCHAMGIQQSLTSYYHPEANPIERKNRDLKPQLAILVGSDHNTWDIHLSAIRFAMNSATTSSTGYSPGLLTFGRELRAPADAASDMRAIVEGDTVVAAITPYLKRLASTLLHARDVHERVQTRQKQYADEHRRVAPDYEPGSLVLLKTQGPNDAAKGQTPKFIPRRDGPYKVRELAGPTTYILERVSDGEVLGKYHTSQLTPFIGEVQPAVREKRKRGRPRRYLD